MNMSVDGFIAGPDDDMSWLSEHAADKDMAAYTHTIWNRATTVVMGNANYEGFRHYWPGVAADPDADPEYRAFACWLDDVEKVVLSRTRTSAPWVNSRVESDLEGVFRRLRDQPGGDILVPNSASVIRALLTAGLLDELRLNVLPEVVGEGKRLFPGSLPRSSWTLTANTTLPTGAVGLTFVRR